MSSYFRAGNNYEFCMYDFGRKGNQEKYGQETPPIYEPEKVTAPVATYWSDNDWLAAPEVRIYLMQCVFGHLMVFNQ